MTFPNASHEGLSYFLRRAAAMSLEDARNVLKLETTTIELYHNAWCSADAIYCEKVERFPNHNWNRMPKECFIAVTCYTLDSPMIARDLNAWCRLAQPRPSSWDLFPYKSLWCFLLRAFENLPMFPVKRVFRVVQEMYETPSNKVLLTEFVSASVLSNSVYNYAVPEGIQEVFSNVPAEMVRNISLYSTRENNLEVLIWPFCTFYVFQISPNAFEFNFCSESPPCHLPGLLPAWS